MAASLLLLLQLVSLASASHHYGGTVSYSYKGRNPDGSFRVDFRNRATYDGNSSTKKSPNGQTFSDEGKWMLLDPNTSPDIAILPFLRVPQNCPRTYKLMSFDPDGDTVRCRYGNIRNIECSGCNQPSGFVLDQGSCSLHYRHAIANPSVFGFELVVEDFPERPISLSYTDGTQSYKAPLIPMRHKRSYYHTYPPTASAPITTPAENTMIPTTHPWGWCTDHDLSTKQPHGGGATTTRQTPAPPLPTYWPWLHTTPTTTDNRYLHGTTPPLSKLPLQFSFLVDPPAPSCVDGLYLPKFVHPTPENGQHINAEVNKEVEIRVRAQASHATLHDIIISGPLNITKHRSTHGDFVIRWTPGPDDVGDHYPICFAVESVIDPASTLPPQTTIYNGYHYHVGVAQSPQSGIYQSEMRCVLVNIGKILVESHVTCHESSMTVEVTRSSLPGLHEDHLRLNDPSNTACNLQTNSNSTHIIAVVPLNACGTQIEEDEENLVFKNEITTVDSVHDLITRNHLLEVQFYCQYPKLGNVSQGFTAHRRNVLVWDKGFGKFSYEFEFYPDSQYR
ncbi:Oncoprotein-induced transcript 3 protein [Dissostichus eleginoides]|uniref:Oncoprotein-induced transcript 3 protein n=1 Tax=Dissostichus eleginoides TaxID=100907 RepID=A0AAD9BYJ9_DISEL|nr:Oncoprotein-induced transcript 3 protein [Dissostichus eleginoides]